MSNNVGGGNLGARLQALLRNGQDALARLKGGGKDTKATDTKPEVKGGSTAQGSSGPQAAKGKGKAKGANSAALDALVGGTDGFGMVDNEEKERKRKQRFFTGGDNSSGNFETKDATEEKSAVAHISAEFRGQVASGMVEGRSFTQGSCLVPETAPEEEEEEPVKQKRR